MGKPTYNELGLNKLVILLSVPSSLSDIPAKCTHKVFTGRTEFFDNASPPNFFFNFFCTQTQILLTRALPPEPTSLYGH